MSAASSSKSASASAPAVEEKNECVKVVVRMRPFNSTERERGEACACDIDTATGSVRVRLDAGDGGGGGAADADGGGDTAKQFTFDRAYDDTSTQKAVFAETARPIVDSVIEGFNGTIFAYGQTGTGKTFTMEGVAADEQLRGIMPNTFQHIFEHIAARAGANLEFLVRASFLEIYNDEVYDLLNAATRARMEVKESKDKGIFVKDLSTYVVKNVAEISKVMRKGQKSRQVGATQMNPGSSRSHSIFTIMIETCETAAPAAGSGSAEGESHYRAGKLNLVDLAGSERQKKTGAGGERLDEAKAINLSLSALGNVIKALVSGKAKHVPFRDSKLTRLLQDSLGGNTKTMMIANFGPAASNIEETVSTLRYADRAKHIKNKPRINEDPKDTALRAYLDEIAVLKAQLEARRTGGGGGRAGAAALASPTSALNSSMMQNVDTLLEEEVVVVEKLVSKTIDVTDEIVQQKREEARAQIEQIQDAALRERELMKLKQSEAERKRIEYEAKLAHNQAQLSHEQRELQQLEQAIAEKEARLLHGGQIMDQAAKQRIELTHAERELSERHALEERLKADLRTAEQNEAYMKQQYVSQEQELEIKTGKLKQLWAAYKGREQELSELQEEFAAEREELMDHLRELTREIRLRDVVLESFVPLSALQLIEERAQWDAMNDAWHIPGIEYAGNQMRRADPPDEMYRPPPIAYDRLLRLVGGGGAFGQPSPQMQESLHMAAAAATHEADYAFAAFAAANGASVRASAASSSAMADASLHVPPAHARDPYFSYGVDAEKMQRKLEKRKAGAGGGMTSKRK